MQCSCQCYGRVAPISPNRYHARLSIPSEARPPTGDADLDGALAAWIAGSGGGGGGGDDSEHREGAGGGGSGGAIWIVTPVLTLSGTLSAVGVGLGRIVALDDRPFSVCQIHWELRCLEF